jgi:hypothetical protein
MSFFRRCISAALVFHRAGMAAKTARRQDKAPLALNHDQTSPGAPGHGTAMGRSRRNTRSRWTMQVELRLRM